MNLAAFRWGRRAAVDEAEVRAAAKLPVEPEAPETLDQTIERNAAFLKDYQNKAYAKKYRDFVAAVRSREQAFKSTGLTEAVARYLFKLMAYKDEYEVGRLYSNGQFAEALGKRFKGGRLSFYLAPPMLARIDPVTGHPRKMKFGPWVMKAFKVLASLRVLRGTPLDIFGMPEERRRERALIKDYRSVIEGMMRGLNEDNLALAIEIASLPEQIRGFGHVKHRNLLAVKAREAELLSKFAKPFAASAEKIAAE
jgi:indolepyruvate ferredoxin oxidoreductase